MLTPHVSYLEKPSFNVFCSAGARSLQCRLPTQQGWRRNPAGLRIGMYGLSEQRLLKNVSHTTTATNLYDERYYYFYYNSDNNNYYSSCYYYYYSSYDGYYDYDYDYDGHRRPPPATVYRTSEPGIGDRAAVNVQLALSNRARLPSSDHTFGLSCDKKSNMHIYN